MSEDFARFLAELKEKCDLVEIIGSYIKIERRGNNYWACCPFHHEKTPSFAINAAEKYYHCFGCGASGDVIGFVKEYENVDFNQAVEILAARAKIEVPSFDQTAREEIKRRREKRDRLLSLMKDTARFYLSNLYSGKAEAHLTYLLQRKILPGTMKKFGLGASLDYTSLPKYLLDKGYDKRELMESGVCSYTADGRMIDAEGGRLIIPIINNLDEVVAFGGRLIGKSDRAKYKNTKETVLFDKSKNLFNVNLVKKLRKTSAITSLIMVEGYMDAISLYQAGFENVVASMGTSLTKEQARLCKRYTDTVYISYDGDFAGQKANLRGLEILKQEGIKVRVVPLPEGLDPDDVIKRDGAEGYRECLERGMPLLDFKIHAAKLKFDLSHTDEKRDFVQEALTIVREAESETEKEDLLKKISLECGVSLTSLLRDFEQVPQKEERASLPPPKEEGDGICKAERFVLAACLFNKPYAVSCNLDKLSFSDETRTKVAEYISEERASAGRVRPGGIFDLVQENSELSLIFDLETGENLNGKEAEKFFQDSLLCLEQRMLDEQIQSCKAAYDKAPSEEKQEILELLGELLMKKQKKLKLR